MILKKKNPRGHRLNALQILTLHGICCGDSNSAIVCKYKAVIDTSATSTVDKISIGGEVYEFGVVIDLTSERGVKMLIEKIGDALFELGYTEDGVSYQIDGNQLCIETYYSQVAFDWIANASLTFIKTECTQIGDGINDTCCDATVVFTIQMPTKFSFPIPTAMGSVGDILQLRDADGNVLFSWVSDGLGTSSFLMGGAAYTEMMNQGVVFNVDTTTNTLFVNESPVVLADIFNLTTSAAVDVFTAIEPTYLNIKPIACQEITNVTVNDGTNDVYVGAVSQNSSCIIYDANGLSKDGCILLNVDGLGYSGTVTFTVTVESSGCDPVTETFTVNF